MVLGYKHLMTGDIEQLFAELRKEADQRNKQRKMVLSCAVGVMCVVVVAFILNLVTTGKGSPNLTTMSPILISLIVVTTVYSQRHKSLVAELAARKDPRILGDLLEASESTDNEVLKLAESALPDILPIWLEGDQELSPEDRSRLYKLLDTGRPVELVESVMSAMQQIGGLESVSYLENFKRKTENHKMTRWQRLSTRALEVLADVRMREAKRIIDAGPVRDDIEPQTVQA